MNVISDGQDEAVMRSALNQSELLETRASKTIYACSTLSVIRDTFTCTMFCNKFSFHINIEWIHDAYKRSMSLVSNANVLIQISLHEMMNHIWRLKADEISGANTIMEAYYLLLYNIVSQIKIVYFKNCLNQQILPLLSLSNSTQQD